MILYKDNPLLNLGTFGTKMVFSSFGFGFYKFNNGDTIKLVKMIETGKIKVGQLSTAILPYMYSDSFSGEVCFQIALWYYLDN